MNKRRSNIEAINDYEKLFKTDEGYDVIIFASENENGKEIHAFSNILVIHLMARKLVGSDLYFYNGMWYHNHANHYCSYPKFGIPENKNGFKADDYEVFQVVKK
ncbi:unnamed protein product [Rhizophagus irregularis]|nr:unnamed protein product [Rhizophagus irregularis]